MDAAGIIVNVEKLALSKDPSGELAAAAMQAAEAAGLELGRADFVIIAVPASQAEDRVVEAATAAIGELEPAPTA